MIFLTLGVLVLASSYSESKISSITLPVEASSTPHSTLPLGTFQEKDVDSGNEHIYVISYDVDSPNLNSLWIALALGCIFLFVVLCIIACHDTEL